MGMAHKLHAYATAVGLSLTDDSVLLQFGAVSLGVVEFILGIYLLIGVHRRLTTIVTALFMLIFTAITVWIYIDNPVADCGCFGDAITLTNGQTLAKNIVLLSAAVYLSCYPQKNPQVYFSSQQLGHIHLLMDICHSAFTLYAALPAHYRFFAIYQRSKHQSGL